MPTARLALGATILSSDSSALAIDASNAAMDPNNAAFMIARALWWRARYVSHTECENERIMAPTPTQARREREHHSAQTYS